MLDLRLEGELDLLPGDVGGRRRPIGSGYRAAMWFGETDPTGRPQLHSAVVTVYGADQVAPGDSAKVALAPLAWETWPEITTGTRFEVFEGGRHIGSGRLQTAPQEEVTQFELRRALHASLEEWVIDRFGDRVVRERRADDMAPDLIARFRDVSGTPHVLVAEVIAHRPAVEDVQRLTTLMHSRDATLGLLVGLDEPSAETWSAIVAEGGVELPGSLWMPRVRVLTTRDLGRGDAELLPSQQPPEQLELLAV